MLGLKGAPPEVPAGQSSTVSALVPPLAGATVVYEWTLCTRPPDPGLGETISPDCLNDGPADYLVPLGTDASAKVTMPMVTPDQLGVPDPTLGVYLPVRLRVAAANQRVTAFYPLRLSIPGLPPNQNPTLEEIDVVTGNIDAGSPDGGAVLTPLVDGTPYPVHLADTLTLRASVTPDSYQHFYELDPTTQMPVDTVETMRLSWFTSAGELAEDVTGNEALPNQTLKLDQHPPKVGDVIDLYVVARDGRGGTDWAHRSLVVVE